MNQTRQSPHHRWRIVLLPMACLLLSAVPRIATADLLDDVLGVASSVGMIDQDVVRSKPLIECLIGGGDALTCTNAVANVQEGAVKMLPATDSNIKLIVDLVQAVADERWLEVLELTGENGFAIACKLIPGGNVSGFFCSGIAKKALTIAKSTFTAVYGAVVEGDWWELIAVIHPDLLTEVCNELLPSELNTIVCGGLLQVVGELVALLENGVGIIVDVFEGLAKVFTGPEDEPLDPAKYYQSYWRMGNLHWMVLSALKTPGPEIGVWPTFTHGNCVTYYDNHRLAKDDAEKLCQQMGDSLLAEAKSYKKLALEAVPAYLKGSLQPRRFAHAAASWGDIPVSGVINKANDRILDLYKWCKFDVNKILDHLPPYSTLNGNPIMKPPTIQDWICEKALNEQFLPQLTTAKAELEKTILAPLLQAKTLGRLGLQQASECKLSTGYYSPNLIVTCDTFDKWRSCRSTFFDLGIGLEEKDRPECRVNHLAAGTKLASEIAAKLGPRCTSNVHTVECTREWKVAACHARAGEVLAGLPGTPYLPNCIFKSTPAYEAAKAKARDILNILNGASPVDIGPGGQAIPTTVFPADTACYSLPDPLVLKCRGRFDIPEIAQGKLSFCEKDPNNDGSDVPCYLDMPDAKEISTSPLSELPAATSINPVAVPTVQRPDGAATRETPMQPDADSPAQHAGSPDQVEALPGATAPDTAPARTVAPGLRALNSQSGAAPPNPCRYEASYYEPLPPVIETSSRNFQVGDQAQIQCAFVKRTKMFEWQQCDDFAKNAIQVMQLDSESGSRYSGLFVVDGVTIGVSTSPMEGGDFDDEAIWAFSEAGVHVVSCMVDNGLRPAEIDGAVYLESQSEFAVSGATGSETFRRFDPDTARRLPTRETPSELIRREPKP